MKIVILNSRTNKEFTNFSINIDNDAKANDTYHEFKQRILDALNSTFGLHLESADLSDITFQYHVLDNGKPYLVDINTKPNEIIPISSFTEKTALAIKINEKIFNDAMAYAICDEIIKNPITSWSPDALAHWINKLGEKWGKQLIKTRLNIGIT